MLPLVNDRCEADNLHSKTYFEYYHCDVWQKHTSLKMCVNTLQPAN